MGYVAQESGSEMVHHSNGIVPVSMMKEHSLQTNCVNKRNISLLQ